jgi:hypothetical protein
LAQPAAGRDSGAGGEVREEAQAAALARRAGWWLVVPVDGRGELMSAARGEHPPEVVALGYQVHAEVQR